MDAYRGRLPVPLWAACCPTRQGRERLGRQLVAAVGSAHVVCVVVA